MTKTLEEPERTPQELELADTLPAARVEPRKRWRLTAIWVVPVVAAIVGGYLVISRLQEFGPTISIQFKDGTGVKPGQTEIRYRGVPVGEVATVELSKDEQHVVVKARLRRSASSLARDGAMFWIVRPEVGIGTISGTPPSSVTASRSSSPPATALRSGRALRSIIAASSWAQS